MVTVALVTEFCVEMDGVFPLDRASIGKRADVTTSTLLSPAAIIFKDGEIFGPHVSSFGNASDKSSAALNGTPFKKSSMWTLNIVVMFASCECPSFDCSMANSYSCLEHEQTDPRCHQCA